MVFLLQHHSQHPRSTRNFALTSLRTHEANVTEEMYPAIVGAMGSFQQYQRLGKRYVGPVSLDNDVLTNFPRSPANNSGLGTTAVVSSTLRAGDNTVDDQ